jgi:ABC-2 type transport system permease protein
MLVGLVTLATAALFVPLEVQHPLAMLGFLLLISVTFSLFGFIIGLVSQSFEQLQFIPMLVVTPLTFLGGAFYSIDMLPPAWRMVTLFNPVVYLIDGFRWAFYGLSDVGVGVSAAAMIGFFVICLSIVGWMFKTGYRLKN